MQLTSRLRLVLPSISEAMKSCHDIEGLEYCAYGDNFSVDALLPHFEGFDCCILVPTLDGNCIEFTKTVLKVVEFCKFKMVICIGGHRVNNLLYPALNPLS